MLLSSRDRPLAEVVPALPDRFLALIGQSGTSPAPTEGATVPLSEPPVAAAPAAVPEPEAQKPDMPAVTPAPLQPVTTETIAPPAGPDPAKPAVGASAPIQVATTSGDRPVTSVVPPQSAETTAESTAGSESAEPVIPPSEEEPAAPSVPDAAEAASSPTAPAATPVPATTQAETPVRTSEPAKVNMAALTDGSPVPPSANAATMPAGRCSRC